MLNKCFFVYVVGVNGTSYVNYIKLNIQSFPKMIRSVISIVKNVLSKRYIRCVLRYSIFLTLLLLKYMLDNLSKYVILSR